MQQQQIQRLTEICEQQQSSIFHINIQIIQTYIYQQHIDIILNHIMNQEDRNNIIIGSPTAEEQADKHQKKLTKKDHINKNKYVVKIY